MDPQQPSCPDCECTDFDRRDFLRTSVTGLGVAAAAASVPLFATARAVAAPTRKSPPETAVRALYESLTANQKKDVCFGWDYKDPQRGILRTHVSNNWHITRPTVSGNYFTKKQVDLIRSVYDGLINKEWHARFLKHLKDDSDGRDWGFDQNIAIFGTPNDTDKFEFVMTGRHLTMRADGHTTENVAFGGPIFYGHAASGFNEKAGHPGNVFWPQAVQANKVYKMLDAKQKEKALVARQPAEAAVGFKGEKAAIPGLPVTEMSEDQKKEMQKTLACLLEPFRKDDQDEAMECLKKRGGLDKCHLILYRQGALTDGEYDCWRLEGPAFVWYFRGTPHVHVWVNIADEPSLPLNARG